MWPILATISYGVAAAAFFIIYLSSGYPPPADIVGAAVFVTGSVAGILSLVLFSLVRWKAVSTIIVNETGITLTTIAGHRQTLRWDHPSFRLVLRNRGQSFEGSTSNDDAGVLEAPRAFKGWPTTTARDAILRVAREHGVRAWTWHPWALYTAFPSTTLLAHKLSFTDRLRGLRTARPDP
jgi:hypothetical protein